MILEGERADEYLDAMKELEKGIPEGMRRFGEVLVSDSSSEG